MLLKELAAALGASVEPASADASLSVTRVLPLDEADAASVSLFTGARYLDLLKATRAAAVLCERKVFDEFHASFPVPALVVPKTHLGMAQAVVLLHPPPQHAPGVHPLAHVHPEAQLGAGVCVLPLAYVGRARVGARSVVYPHVFLDDDVEVGDDAVLYPHVVLLRGTRVGARAILHSGAVLGADGFGFTPGPAGRLVKIPQVGTVRAGDDVEVGANTTVDRANLGTTLLGSGTKLDNQVQVAHNVKLGENVVIAGQSGVAGSSTIGNNVVIGGTSGVADHLTLGDNAKLAGASFLSRDIPAGELWIGAPAMPAMERGRMEVHLRKLSETVRTVKKLEKRVQELEARLAERPRTP